MLRAGRRRDQGTATRGAAMSRTLIPALIRTADAARRTMHGPREGRRDDGLRRCCARDERPTTSNDLGHRQSRASPPHDDLAAPRGLAAMRGFDTVADQLVVSDAHYRIMSSFVDRGHAPTDLAPNDLDR